MNALTTNETTSRILHRIDLLNAGGAEPLGSGPGLLLARLPAPVRAPLNERARIQYRKPAHTEIRFVLNAGAKLDAVAFDLEVLPEDGQMGPPGTVAIEYFRGDYQVTPVGTRLQSGCVETITFPDHETFARLADCVPGTRYSPSLFRLVLHGAATVLHDVRGDIHPPRHDELPPVMMAYGTSITHGHAASRTDLTWASLTARALGYDLVNLGTGGSAHCEPEIADYMATQPWDLCTLELSVNMVGQFEVEQFRARAAYFVNTLAAARPQATVACISLFPYFNDFNPQSPLCAKAAAFRETLEAICQASPHSNIRFIPGPSLLPPEGLSHDLLHPSDHGMLAIATRLAASLAGARV